MKIPVKGNAPYCINQKNAGKEIKFNHFRNIPLPSEYFIACPIFLPFRSGYVHLSPELPSKIKGNREGLFGGKLGDLSEEKLYDKNRGLLHVLLYQICVSIQYIEFYL